jgi:hypothetical protein
MPIDPRIALAGVSPTYDFMGAYNTSRAAAQTAQANQMAMQAAEATATAQRNAFQEAQTLDPNNQAALRAYALRNPAAAEQVLGGLASADNIFSARGTETRAQKGFETEQRDSLQGFMRNAIASIRNNPSDENIDAVSAQAEAMGIPPAQMAAYAGRFRAVPVEQRTALLDNELATTEDGRALLKTFTRNITMDDVGGSLVPRDTNLLAVGAVMPTAVTKTPDPMKFTDFPTPDGITRVYADGRSEILRGPTGNPLMPAPTREERQDADAAAAAVAAAPQRLKSAQNLTRLIDDAAANTSYWTAGLGSITAVVPGTPAADLAGTMESIKSNLAFDRLQQMRDESRTGGALGQIVLRELDMLASVWASTQQSQSPPQLRENLGVLRDRSVALEAAYQAMVDAGAGGGGGGTPSAPAGGGQVAYDTQGNRFVVRNGQWVRE